MSGNPAKVGYLYETGAGSSVWLSAVVAVSQRMRLVVSARPGEDPDGRWIGDYAITEPPLRPYRAELWLEILTGLSWSPGIEEGALQVGGGGGFPPVASLFPAHHAGGGWYICAPPSLEKIASGREYGQRGKEVATERLLFLLLTGQVVLPTPEPTTLEAAIVDVSSEASDYSALSRLEIFGCLRGGAGEVRDEVESAVSEILKRHWTGAR